MLKFVKYSLLTFDLDTRKIHFAQKEKYAERKLLDFRKYERQKLFTPQSSRLANSNELKLDARTTESKTRCSNRAYIRRTFCTQQTHDEIHMYVSLLVLSLYHRYEYIFARFVSKIKSSRRVRTT